MNLVNSLRSRYGATNVVASDFRRPQRTFASDGPFCSIDVCDHSVLNAAIVEYNVDVLVHLSSVLSSASGEKDVPTTISVKTQGIENVLEAARMHRLRVVAPSSISVFGGCHQRETGAPTETIMRPSTIYGVTNQYGEMLGEYYNHRFGVDYRCVRYPGILALHKAYSRQERGVLGTTDFAIEMIRCAVNNEAYSCFLGPDTTLPWTYLPDVMEATIALIEAPEGNLSRRVYNLTSMAFSPRDLEVELKQRFPSWPGVDYEPDFRHDIASTWPADVDDAQSATDWGWQPQYSLSSALDELMTAGLPNKSSDFL